MVEWETKRLYQEALVEDTGSGDVTTMAIGAEERVSRAEIIAKQEGILSGVDSAVDIFGLVDPEISVRANFKEADKLGRGDIVLEIEGRISSILTGERTVLNFLAHLSGVATMTSQFVQMIAHTRARITDTRKTTPLLRHLEKKAVRAGGGVNHRMGLYDMILLKENHIAAAGGILSAVNLAREFKAARAPNVKIEVETRSLAEVREAVSCQVDRIMLDNMDTATMRKAVALINGKAEIEASGGVTMHTVREIAETGVDLISVGALTHSAPAFDFSLLIKGDSNG
ncbi:MAG: carboxylating nicotinate-nucleotide diphosphorylase [Calditrichales bacterium]|nr:MAG: carboxylating nicotinate-nucleotide diphosphorylase [Calditrichales bacterium]